MNVTIDSYEKKKAWLQLVEFLDDLQEIDESHSFIKKINDGNIEPENSHKDIRNEMITKVLSNDLEYREKLKKQFIEMMHTIE